MKTGSWAQVATQATCMADPFDGTAFVGIDADALGDVSAPSNSPAQPVDVALQQAVDSNQGWLNPQRVPVSCTFASGERALNSGNAQGDRVYASITDWVSPICIPWLNAPRLASVELTLLHAIANQSTGAPDNTSVNYRLELYRNGYKNLLKSTSGTLAESDYHVETLTLTLDRPTQAPRFYRGSLQLWIQSQDAGDTGENVGLTSLGTAIGTTSANGELAAADPSPSSASHETQFLEQDTSDAEQRRDIIGIRENASSAENIWTRPQLPPTGSAQSHSLRWLTYMQMRSAAIEAVYSTDHMRAGVDTLAARQPVRGRDAMRAAGGPKAVYDLPRLLAWGPGGYRLDDVEHPSDMALRWPVADGAGTNATLIDDMVTLDRTSGRVEVLLYVIPTIYAANNYMTGDQACVSTWDFTATLEEFDTTGTDWADATALDTDTRADVTLTTYQTSAVKQPFLLTKYLQHQASTTGLDWAYAYREGSIYPADLPLISQISMTLDFSSLSAADMNTNYRLHVGATYDADSLSPQSMVSSSIAANVNRYIHLTCVGWSAWSVSNG